MATARQMLIEITGKTNLTAAVAQAKKQLGEVSGSAAKSGASAGSEFVRGADGRLRDANGKFAKTTSAAFAGTKSGASKSGKATGESFGSGLLESAKKLVEPVAALFAVDKLKDFGKEIIENAEDEQRATAQTNAVLKSTGGAANISAEAIDKLTTSLSNKTAIDRDQVRAGENMLLTFTNIRNGVGKNNKIFDQATKITADMATATGTGMRTAALQLGKALNDPAAGMTKLQRVGVTFTEQQKKQVAQLQKSGDTMGAQKIILNELNREFGGSAAAQATAGDKLKNTWRNFEVELGQKVLPTVDKFFEFVADKGIPALDSMIDGFTRGVGWIKQNKNVIEPLAAIVGVLAAGYTALSVQQDIMAAGSFLKWMTEVTKTTKLWEGAQAALDVVMDANPIGLVVIAVAALVAGFIVAYKKSATFRAIVQDALGGVKKVALDVWHWFTGSFVPFFTKTLPNGFRTGLADAKKVWSGIESVITVPFRLAKTGVTAGWSAIEGTFTKSKNWVGSTWRKGWTAAKSWISDPIGSGEKAVAGFLDNHQGVASKLSGLKSWASGTWSKGWANMRYNLSHPVQFGKNTIDAVLGSKGVQATFSTLNTWGQSIFGKRWAGMKAKLAAPIDDAKAYFKRVFGPGGGGMRQVFSDFVSGVGKIFSKIKAALFAPIRDAIDLVNQDLIKGGINWLLFKLGVPKSKGVPWIPVPKGFATGTENTGGRPYEPRGVVHGQEAVIPHLARQRAERERPGGLGYLIKTGRWPVGPAAELPGVNQNARPGAGIPANLAGVPGNLKAIAARGPRPGDRAGWGAVNPIGYAESQLGHFGWYNRCLAFVNAAWNYTVGRFKLATAHASGSAGPLNRTGTPPSGAAVYWNPNHVALADGKGDVFSNDIIKPGEISLVPQSLIGSKWGLQYRGWWSPTGAKGAPGGFFGGLASDVLGFLKGLDPLQWLQNKAAGIGSKITSGGLFGAGLARIPVDIVKDAASVLTSKWFGGGASSANPPGTGVERWRGVITRALGMNKLPTTKTWQDAWLRQVATESGGNPNAVQGITDVHSASGDLAKGLLQTISATFNAYKFPGHGNIFNGLDDSLAAMNYAKHTYPDILSVIGHGHGYDNGGPLNPGWTLAYNGTGKPENVQTAAQAAAAGERKIEIHLHGVLDSVTAAREIKKLMTQYSWATGPVQVLRNAR